MSEWELIQLAAWGAGVAATLFLAWRSRAPAHLMLALILLGEWAVTNTVQATLGLGLEPIINPTVDAFFAVCVAAVGLSQRSILAALIFSLFTLLGGFYVTAWIVGIQGTEPYLAFKNTVFAAQLLTIGGASGILIALRNGRAPLGGKRFSSHPSRW